MKFRYKITLWMVCILAVFYGISGTLLISISFQSDLEREREAARDSYQMILNTIQVVSHMEDQNSYTGILEILEQLDQQGNFGWEALRLMAENSILYSTGSSIPYFQNLSAELDSDHCLIAHFSDGEQREYIQISGYVTVGTQQMVLDVAYEITPVYAERELQQEVYNRIYLVMLVLCLLVVYLISYFLTRPLSGLSKAARRIASGNLAYRSMIRSNDEIGILSEDFNSMAEQVEQSMKRMQETMEQQERFMGSFAHELKTPMTSMIGYADLIRRQTLSKEEEAEAANYIVTEGKRLERLSFKMLEIFSADKKDIAFIPVAPAALLQDLAERLQPVYAEKGIQLEWSGEEGICLLEPDLVESLLLNLIDNAHKALKGSGWIRLSSRMLPAGCEFIVEDSGDGIPEEAMEHLTEAFYRVDKARSRAMGGVGLGLTFCAKIAEIHQGGLRFENQKGRGLRVLVELKGGRVE